MIVQFNDGIETRFDEKSYIVVKRKWSDFTLPNNRYIMMAHDYLIQMSEIAVALDWQNSS